MNNNYRKGETYEQFMKRQGTPARPISRLSEKVPAQPTNPTSSKPVEELIKEMLGRA